MAKNGTSRLTWRIAISWYKMEACDPYDIAFSGVVERQEWDTAIAISLVAVTTEAAYVESRN